MNDTCTCGVLFRDAEDFRDHMPCPGNTIERELTESRARYAGTMSKPLTFGELTVNEEFIAFPRDGDDSGHGGYRRGSYLFVKFSDSYEGGPNARRHCDGNVSAMPKGMQVLKILGRWGSE